LLDCFGREDRVIFRRLDGSEMCAGCMGVFLQDRALVARCTTYSGHPVSAEASEEDDSDRHLRHN
jgi:hypothetical protein